MSATIKKQIGISVLQYKLLHLLTLGQGKLSPLAISSILDTVDKKLGISFSDSRHESQVITGIARAKKDETTGRYFYDMGEAIQQYIQSDIFIDKLNQIKEQDLQEILSELDLVKLELGIFSQNDIVSDEERKKCAKRPTMLGKLVKKIKRPSTSPASSNIDILVEELKIEKIKNYLLDFLEKTRDDEEETINIFEEYWKYISKLLKDDHILTPKDESIISEIENYIKSDKFMSDMQKLSQDELNRALFTIASSYIIANRFAEVFKIGEITALVHDMSIIQKNAKDASMFFIVPIEHKYREIETKPGYDDIHSFKYKQACIQSTNEEEIEQVKEYINSHNLTKVAIKCLSKVQISRILEGKSKFFDFSMLSTTKRESIDDKNKCLFFGKRRFDRVQKGIIQHMIKYGDKSHIDIPNCTTNTETNKSITEFIMVAKCLLTPRPEQMYYMYSLTRRRYPEKYSSKKKINTDDILARAYTIMGSTNITRAIFDSLLHHLENDSLAVTKEMITNTLNKLLALEKYDALHDVLTKMPDHNPLVKKTFSKLKRLADKELEKPDQLVQYLASDGFKNRLASLQYKELKQTLSLLHQHLGVEFQIQGRLAILLDRNCFDKVQHILKEIHSAYFASGGTESASLKEAIQSCRNSANPSQDLNERKKIIHDHINSDTDLMKILTKIPEGNLRSIQNELDYILSQDIPGNQKLFASAKDDIGSEKTSSTKNLSSLSNARPSISNSTTNASSTTARQIRRSSSFNLAL